MINTKKIQKCKGSFLLTTLKSGAGNTVHPDKAVFFLNYGIELKRHLEKAERENGFIYHQKIPEKLPELNLKATHGLAEPEAYSLPEKRYFFE